MMHYTRRDDLPDQAWPTACGARLPGPHSPRAIDHPEEGVAVGYTTRTIAEANLRSHGRTGIDCPDCAEAFARDNVKAALVWLNERTGIVPRLVSKAANHADAARILRGCLRDVTPEGFVYTQDRVLAAVDAIMLREGAA